MASLDRQRLLRLIPYLGRDRRRLLLTLLLLIPLALSAAVQPLLVGQAIAVLRGEPTMAWLQGQPVPAALRWLVLLLLAAVAVRLSLQSAQSYNVQAIGQRLTARIRDDLFRHALALSLRFHDRTPVGKLLTRLTSDVDALAEVFGSGAFGVLADLVTLLVIAITMISIEWRLGLLLLLSQVPVTLGILWLQGRYRTANYRVREELGQLNADLQENMQGLEVVQMFRREAYNSARFARTTDAYRKAVTGTILFDSSISAFIEWVALSAVAVVLALGGWMVTSGSMGLGVLTTFILFSQRLFDPLRQLAERFTQIQGGLTAVERIGELLEQPIEIGDLPEEQRSAAAIRSGALRASAGEVVFENVSFAYRSDDPILEDLSFRIAPGEHVALVGPTGSGKSTVIRLLCRLYEPQRGRILLDGIDIRQLPIPTLRQRLGVVLQDTFLFSGNVADNLRLDAAIDNARLKQLCHDLGLDPLLRRLPDGLQTELRERGANLSSGERQLLAVARVAIRDPSVLVMDEATAFLDPSTEATLQRDLESLLQERTAIVIAHRLATVEAADRILVLRKGRLIEQGNHRDLREAGGLYAQLADLQEKGLARL
ncbi:ABC transporter ATP-binding protein [Synechococcus sp. CCY9201]|uniref:ABC transporter ATP-binding protein n=1 Tax=unclassified Synechococcus TaxID=2626047 RepID=UPI0018CFA046|nr:MULTISPECIES: ABC transporter ATP-binding protein [unclassified Synechococcus]MEA5423577.1 ABC transporter ATP-binding protein [Synechococcus sp. CCY9202]MEA5475921.1 ABC transporter ATP-binding protein [Synechococcus sp. CCY9201]QPN59951.1 ABC transporter ATP-binding protein [Synechococcus sp. CBW1002]QPN66757.1 ABC transporter ATP-binding protein [Synechococcus sp. CBW1006]CAK6692300.1 putative ABC transporter ATP-binding protein [Synechococcus sp. CBW1107]